jgi:multidrug efflux pump subunit AcrA (membrane-fusion protein)
MTSTTGRTSRWLWLAGAIGVFAVVAVYLSVNPPAWLRGQDDKASRHDAHDEHDHDDHEPAVNVTVWTDELEVFVTHPYAVVGEPLGVAVHVTRLRTAAPVSKGTISAEFRGAGGASTVTAPAPNDPGLWLLQFQPDAAGEYQVSLQISLGDADGGQQHFELPALTVFASDEEAHKAEDAAASEGTTDVEFIKEQQWRIGMRSAVIEPQSIAESLTVPGTVVAPHGAEAMIVPPIPGRVTPPKPATFPRIGDRVAAGQLLGVIEPSVAGPQAVQLLVNQAQLKTLDAELAAKQLDVETEIAAAQVDLELARSDFERLRGLSGGGVVAEKKLVEAQHRFRQTTARLEGLQRVQKTYAAAHERLASFLGEVRGDVADEDDPESLFVPLRSPLEGTIVAAEVTAGEFVGDDHALFRVVDMQKLNIDANVSEYDIARVKDSQGAKFRLSAYPDRVLPIYGPGDGRLLFIGGVVDPDSRTVPVRFEVPNKDDLLRVGMYADVMIETERRENAIVVPERAVIDDSGETIVYIQTGGETFERRTVRLGIRDGDDIEIRDGLAAGERVVIEGAYAIRLSTLAGGVPEHHHHH